MATPPTAPSAPRTIAAIPPIRGVIVLVAGLNNRPDVLDPIAHALAAMGYESQVVTLTGHGSEDWPSVDYFQAWRLDVQRALDVAAARHADLPVFAIGYSLGGAMLLDAASAPAQRTPLSALALIAPAVSLTTKTAAIRPLLWLSGTGLALPSLAPAGVRAHRHTPLRAYRGLFKAADRASGITPTALSLPIVVFAQREDELVAFDDLVTQFSAIPSARVVELETMDPPTGYHHLLFARENIGEAAWTAMIDTLLETFERLSRP